MVRWPEVGTAQIVAVDFARVHSVPLERFPGWHVRAVPPAERDAAPLDLLVPLNAPNGGMPGRLQAGENYFFWVEFVPGLGTPPGAILAPIVLESAGKPVGTLNVELTTLPITLPEAGDLMALAEVDYVGLFRHHLSGSAGKASAISWYDLPDRQKHDDLLLDTIRLLQAHRVAGLLPGLRPNVKVSPRGELNVDWTAYDSVAEPLLSGQAFPNRIPHPAWLLPLRVDDSGVDAGSFNAPDSLELTRQYVAESARHFDERGWLSRSFALVNSSPLPTADSLASEAKWAGLVRSARPDIRVASRRFPQSMEPYGWVDFPKLPTDSINIWIPDGQYYDARSMATQRDSNRQGWLAADRPPFSGSTSIHSRPGDTLALGWQSGSLAAEHVWLGPINDWPVDDFHAEPASVARAHPKALLFPGKPFGLDRPVPTLRLKRIRETMQHAAYVRLLTQHGKGHIAQALSNSLIAYAGSAAYRTHFLDGRPIAWPDSEVPYENARRIMGLEIAGTIIPGGSGEYGSDFAWRTFMTTMGRVKMTVEGTRVRLTGTPVQPKVQVETWFTIMNSNREPLRSTIGLLEVPTSCETVESEEPIDIPVGRSQRGRLSLVCNATWIATGRKDITVRLGGVESESIQAPARISLIVAEPVVRPLSIDGDLSDWVAAAGNVASDFRLIAGECASTDARDCDRPSLQTMAFTRRDENNLYIAVNAQAHTEGRSSMRRSNVDYDDMIPMDDEDLVEVLIDPLNGGTRSSADLYHIVVKRSGVYHFERGLTTDPPLGPRVPWHTEIEIASRSQSNRWTTEMRIPLATFQRPGRVGGEIWGFNVTHYRADVQEFSTWSGAIGNAYDPLSMGNLLLP